MSQTFIIAFYIALACLAVILGGRMIFPAPHANPSHISLFTIRGWAQTGRMLIMWVPSVLYITGRNIAQGLAIGLRKIVHLLERNKPTEETEESIDS